MFVALQTGTNGGQENSLTNNQGANFQEVQSYLSVNGQSIRQSYLDNRLAGLEPRCQKTPKTWQPSPRGSGLAA